MIRKRRGTEKAEGESGRQAPGKRLRERNWEGRKETSRKAKYQKRTGSAGNRAEGRRKAGEAKAEMAHRESSCEAEPGRRERKNRKAK